MNLKSRGGTTENQSQDMGSGSIGKLLAQLAVPAVVAQIINLLYNIVDRIYIGHIPEIGASALTGVGLFMPILMLINAFAMLCGSGGAPRAAIAMGQKDNETAEKIVGNCFALLIAIAVVLTAVFYVGAPGLLRLFGASDVTPAVCRFLCADLYIGQCFCADRDGHEPVHHYAGLCEDQHDDNCDRRCY